MTDNTNKQLKGNQLSFDAGIKNFKADGSDVVITLVADSKKMNLNTLNEIAQNKLTVDLLAFKLNYFQNLRKSRTSNDFN